MFTTARHRSLSWAKWIYSTPSNPRKTHFNIILLSTLRSSKWYPPFSFYLSRHFCMFRPSHSLFSLNLAIVILWNRNYFALHTVNITQGLWGHWICHNRVPETSHLFGWSKVKLVGFEVLTAVSTKMAVFWVVAPCGLVEIYQRFRGPCYLHHQGDESWWWWRQQGPLKRW
jgi:hypothetical protein